MRVINFTLLAVLGYVTVIGATPLGARAPTGDLDRRQDAPDCTTDPTNAACASCNTFPIAFSPQCSELCYINPLIAYCVSYCGAVYDPISCPDQSPTD